MATIPVGPGYQTTLAAGVSEGSGLPTAAVGLISEPFQGEHILAPGQADAILVGREYLRDPNFALRAADALRFDIDYRPAQYYRAYK